MGGSSMQDTLPESSTALNDRRTRPRVAIIVLTWNSYEVTRECLLSLNHLEYPNFEVIVVDNGSADGSQERLQKEFPSLRLIRNAENLGFTAGNNIGIRDALLRDPDYLLLLNNDTIVAPDFLEQLVRVAEQDAAIGLVNPKILYQEPANKIWYAGGSYRRGRSFARHFGVNRIDNGKYNQVTDVSFVTGCALLAKIEVVRKIGLLDEAFFLGFEDLDWCVRAREAGFRALYAPAAVIWHRTGYVTKKNLGKSVKDYHYVKDSVLLARKHLSARHWPLYVFSISWFLAYRTVGYLIRLEPLRVAAMYRGFVSGWSANIGKQKSDGIPSRETR